MTPTKQRPPLAAMPKPPETKDLEAARARAVARATERRNPFAWGCALFGFFAVAFSFVFAVALVAAIVAHRWGLT
jgi:hypothetical protein